MSKTLPGRLPRRQLLGLSLALTGMPRLATAQGPRPAETGAGVSINVVLADGTARSFSLAELQAMPPETGTARRRDGSSFEVKGVSVTTLLRLTGLDLSRKLGVQQVVGRALVARGADGYLGVFGLALADPHFEHPPLLVTWARSDGTQLPERVGPLQLVNTGEVRTARWVQQLVALEVKAF
jgi:hypothetical protein